MRIIFKNLMGLLPALVLMLLTSGYAVGAAADEWRSEEQVKAAYIFNLLKFTTWPEAHPQQNASMMTVCLSGEPNRVAKTLANELRGRVVQNKPLVVIYIPETLANQDEQHSTLLQQCQLLYLGKMSPSQEHLLINYAHKHAIVSISDQPGFATRHGMVELQTDTAQNRISLLINIEVVEAASITFSSKLLQLARLIRN